MKTLLKTALIVSAFTSIAASANISLSDTNSAVFNIGGTVDNLCKVKSNADSGASSILIDSTQTLQDIGTLEVWCNTGESTTTTYTSANSGFLVSGANKVAYTLNVGKLASDISLNRTYTAKNTAAGSGTEGDTELHALKIKPLSTGLEFAGQYADTITVTVSYN